MLSTQTFHVAMKLHRDSLRLGQYYILYTWLRAEAAFELLNKSTSFCIMCPTDSCTSKPTRYLPTSFWAFFKAAPLFLQLLVCILDDLQAYVQMGGQYILHYCYIYLGVPTYLHSQSLLCYISVLIGQLLWSPDFLTYDYSDASLIFSTI